MCSEKNYCSVCSHCDKKVCADCKEGHLDILRREIARVNNQVRRTLPRLQDALGVIDKNSQQLQQNCLNIIEEIDGLYIRLSKALKDRTDTMKSEIEVFMNKELRSMTGLRANLEHEISNFNSNAEFADKHMVAGDAPSTTTTNNPVSWDDNELMDTKDIFLRTMDFIRNFESEPGDYHRRVRFFVPQDPNQLASTLANLGELTILPSPSSSSSNNPYSQAPVAPNLGPGLMRSKSDHRVAAQFRQAEERYLAYGSDNNEDNLGGGGSRQRYFGDRHGSGTSSRTDRYGDNSSRRTGDYDYDDAPADTGRRSRFRSRFMRHHDSGDSDNEPSSRSVRFHPNESSASESNSVVKSKERQRVLDTEDAARGPLSGITRLADSPRVIKRLQEMEQKGRKKKPTPPSTLNLTPTPMTHQSMASPSARTQTRAAASRQVSEEDEIAKIKKQNKGAEASSSVDTSTTRKNESSVPSTPTSSGDRPRFTTGSDQSGKSSAKKTETESNSSTNATSTNDASEDRTRKRSSYLSTPTTPVETESTPSRSPLATRTSSPAEESSDRSSRRIGRVSTDRFNKSSSESSTSAESSTHSSPVRNTGAAFSTVELKNRFSGGGGNSSGRKSSTGSNNGSDPGANASATMATTTTRSRFGNSNASGTTSPASTGRYGSTAGASSGSSASGTGGTASASGSSSNGTGAAAAHRFQSRFLGRAGTPTAEASRGSENSQSSSSDDSTESSDSDSADKPVSGMNTTATSTTRTGSNASSSAGTAGQSQTKDRELARTDIGPLLARSAQARDTSTYPTNSSNSNSASTPSSHRPSSVSDSPSSYTPRSRANPSGSSASSRPSYGSSRYGTSDSSSATGLSRSRTGSSLAEDLENKYPLTSKYLNRSRANLSSSDTAGSGYGAADSGYGSSSASSASTPRYQRGYQSRFLNKSKSSAALVAPDADEDDVDDDDVADNESAAVDPSSTSSPANQPPSLIVSGDERYPSGRSRYAALKDRRSRLARSKSSHDVGPTPLSPTTLSPFDGGGLVGGDGGNSTAPPSYGQLGEQVGDTGTLSHEPTSPTTEAGSGSSLSTWSVDLPLGLFFVIVSLYCCFVFSYASS